MTKPKILVTAAAGHTGSAAVHQLLENGFPLRAFVRRRDARATALEQAGAELFVGDMFDYRNLRESMVGVQRAYHCPPFAPNLLHNTMLFAVAAEEAKLEVVALMSQWTPHASHPSVITREHWLSNQIYRWMPSVDVIHINPGIFAFIYLLGLPAVAHFGMLMAPFGDGRNAPPSNEDIARVASGVLADPANHIGKSYRPTGPELISSQILLESSAMFLVARSATRISARRPSPRAFRSRTLHTCATTRKTSRTAARRRRANRPRAGGQRPDAGRFRDYRAQVHE